MALRFVGFGQSIGRLAIGVGSIEVGRRLRLRAVDIFGLIVGARAIARIALLDWNLGALGGTVLAAGRIHLTAWSILALAAIEFVLLVPQIPWFTACNLTRALGASVQTARLPDQTD